MKELFNFPAGIDVVHIGIENDLEHHPGMVRAAAAFLIQLPETFKVQALNQSVNHPNWIMLCNILVNSLRKKHCLVGIIRTKMYLCHSENLMPKDTKSLGNNKAPACESRGFVLKKKKVRILTHLLLFFSSASASLLFLAVVSLPPLINHPTTHQSNNNKDKNSNAHP